MAHRVMGQRSGSRFNGNGKPYQDWIHVKSDKCVFSYYQSQQEQWYIQRADRVGHREWSYFYKGRRRLSLERGGMRPPQPTPYRFCQFVDTFHVPKVVHFSDKASNFLQQRKWWNLSSWQMILSKKSALELLTVHRFNDSTNLTIILSLVKFEKIILSKLSLNKDIWTFLRQRHC